MTGPTEPTLVSPEAATGIRETVATNLCLLGVGLSDDQLAALVSCVLLRVEEELATFRGRHLARNICCAVVNEVVVPAVTHNMSVLIPPPLLPFCNGPSLAAESQCGYHAQHLVAASPLERTGRGEPDCGSRGIGWASRPRC